VEGTVDPCQAFFMRPTLVSVGANADGTPKVAIAIGTGNRDEILEQNDVPHRFYVFIDQPKVDENGNVVDEALTESDLTHLTLGSAEASSNYLLGTDSYGWFLEFADADNTTNDWEKVNTAAVVVNQRVIFSTFNPDADYEATVDEDGNVVCRRGGNARTYNMYLLNGNPEPGEERYVQHPSSTAMATEPVVYLGADGKLHVIQALDDLKIDRPMEEYQPPISVLSWKEE
jgi:hypothetical protein